MHPNRSYGENPVLSEIRQRKRLILIGQSLNIFFFNSYIVSRNVHNCKTTKFVERKQVNQNAGGR